MSNIYKITITVGPHRKAKVFAEYLLGEIEYHVMNEKDDDLQGIEVTWGCAREKVPA